MGKGTRSGANQNQTSSNIAGIWQGVLKVGTVELRLVVKLEAQPDGKLTGTMDSPDQGATGIPISEVSLQDNRVRLVVQAVMGLYEGTLSEDGKKMTGEWRQGGITL
ncbi:MAG: alpha/beta hydrolase, partial [bacterium]|nr:alpha/beta hydrolase [bacterium]